MPRKPFQVFLLQAALLLTFLLLLPGTRDLYPRAFHLAGNALLGSMGDGLTVRFRWSDPEARADAADTWMEGREQGRLKYRWRAIFSSYQRGYLPSATLLALTLAAPMSRRRRAAVIPGGLALFNAFFLLQVAGFAWLLFRATAQAPDAPPDAWQRAVPVAKAMFNSPITEFPVVFLIWAGLAHPTRVIDIDSLVESVRRLLGSGTARKPPARTESAEEKSDTPSDQDAPPS